MIISQNSGGLFHQKNAQTMTYSFADTFETWKRIPNFIETDHAKEIEDKTFTDFDKKNNIRRYCR